MPEIKVTVLVEVDGAVQAGFPLVRRIVCDQIVGFNPYLKAAGSYTAIPATPIETLQALVVRPDAAVTLRFAAQSDAGLDVDADGLFLVIGSNIDDGAPTNATVSAAANANLRGFAAGAATGGS